MANQHSDSAMDDSQFWHAYADSSKGANCDHFDRLEEEWQFNAPCAAACSGAQSQEPSYQETQLSKLQEELDSAAEMLDDTGTGLGFFGLSSREIDEWQYDGTIAASAKNKLIDDASHDDLHKDRDQDLDLEVSALRGELAQWLPPT